MSHDDPFKGCLCGKPEYRNHDWFSDDPEENEICKRICSKCPLQQMCAQKALDNKELWGIWGGMEPFHVRKALGFDSFENKRLSEKDLMCPYCLSFDVHIASKRGYTGYACECEYCGIHWISTRHPEKLRKARKRNLQRQKSESDRLESSMDSTGE